MVCVCACVSVLPSDMLKRDEPSEFVAMHHLFFNPLPDPWASVPQLHSLARPVPSLSADCIITRTLK